MLELEHIYKSFEGRTVLSDVSLIVPKGATHALIGSSGSGKTTLLRLTLGLIPFDTGYVKINDQALLSFTPTEWADRIGYVPQEGGLFPHISGRQNVALVPGLRNWPADRIASRVEELRALVDLDPAILERFPHEMSGGQKQRGQGSEHSFPGQHRAISLRLKGVATALRPVIRITRNAVHSSSYERVGEV